MEQRLSFVTPAVDDVAARRGGADPVTDGADRVWSRPPTARGTRRC